jgi:type IV pilus assembly protein PilC
MATFEYRAVNELGRITKGRIEAANLLDLESRIKQMGLELIEGNLSASGSLLRRSVKPRELIDFCFHMEQLLKAGVPLIESVEDFANSLPQGRMREVIGTVIQSVRGGKAFSEALAEHPLVFDNVFVALVHTGEQSGNLPRIFEKLLVSLRWQDELRAQLVKVLIYPAFALTLVIAVFLFFMLYLVPRLAVVLKSLVSKLPPQTELMIAISEFLQHQWGYLLVLVLAMVAVLVVLNRATGRLRYKVDSAKLKVPLIGGIIQTIILSRFVGLLSMLYASGITVTRALEICAMSANNAVIRAGIEDAHNHIVEGKTITDAFAMSGIFPSLVVRMIKIGENSGKLDEALDNAGYFFNRDVQEAVGRLQLLLPQILTVAIGVFIGWMAISVLGPIYEVIGKVTA